MKALICSLVLVVAATGYGQQSPSAAAATSRGPFTDQELRQFRALDPIDTHTHDYQNVPVFVAMLQRLNIHVLDILVAEMPDQATLDKSRQLAWEFVRGSDGHASLCTTFDPFLSTQPGFTQKAIAEINRDFDQGAIAVKIWKNIGEQVKDAKGNYILADNPVFEPIYKDIAARHKTLIAHQADPDGLWEPLTPSSPEYHYGTEHPEWAMYGKPNAPSKAAILRARDHVLEQNPNLRVVGAHLGSMESDFGDVGKHLDRYPNFAVDMAARTTRYMMVRPRAEMIAFMTKYQDRLIYATDLGLHPGANAANSARQWENAYALDWRYFATNDMLEVGGHQVQGLGLSQAILRKIYHDNAVKWFPGILRNSQ